MSRRTLLVIIAVVVLLAPFIGLPYAWLMVLLPILALVILVTILVPTRNKPLSHAREEEAGA